MKRALSALLAAVLLTALCACNQNSKVNDKENTSSDSFDGEIAEYVFEQRINELLPIYQFKASGQPYDNYGNYDYTISVRNKDTDELIQILRFKAVEPDDYDGYPIKFEDVDFDGNLDLIIHVSQGAGSYGMYEVYRWTTAFTSSGFVECFTYGGSNMKIFNETHQLIVYDRPMDGCPEMLYQVERGDDYDAPCIRHLRNMLYTFNDGVVKYEITELINGEWVIIYEVSTEDDKLSDEYSNMLSNYLYFGVAEPITFDEALKLVSEKYGKGDTNTDYPSYEFKQMLTIDGKTYYHIERFYKENSDDTYYNSNDYAVAVDGSKIIDCSNYLAELSARFGNN